MMMIFVDWIQRKEKIDGVLLDLMTKRRRGAKNNKPTNQQTKTKPTKMK